MTTEPRLSSSDRLINEFDKALRSMFVKPQAERISPADAIEENELDVQQTKLSIELMRVNHTGEVCAQALYQGQAITARSSQVKEKMKVAALEEIDHLNWCETRLQELGGRTSLLNPFWYLGSLTMGVTAGWLGDKWSLGFLQETEQQVEQHLAEHLDDLPDNDKKSRAIVAQMKIDEGQHAEMAAASGAAELPALVKKAMATTANAMKFIAAKV